MENSKVISIDQQFSEVVDIILQHKSRASKVVNDELLLSAWHVGGYVSAKLKSEEWGSKVVTQLSEFIRSQHPEIKGYSRRSIYNMVMFYDEYSSETFASTVAKYLNPEFVQMPSAQIGETKYLPQNEDVVIVQPKTAQIVQMAMSRSMSPTMIAEYKRILIPQERMQQQLNEFCNLFLNKD